MVTIDYSLSEITRMGFEASGKCDCTVLHYPVNKEDEITEFSSDIAVTIGYFIECSILAVTTESLNKENTGFLLDGFVEFFFGCADFQIK